MAAAGHRDGLGDDTGHVALRGTPRKGSWDGEPAGATTEAGAVLYEEAAAGRLVADPCAGQLVSRRPKTVTPATSQAT